MNEKKTVRIYHICKFISLKAERKREERDQLTCVEFEMLHQQKYLTVLVEINAMLKPVIKCVATVVFRQILICYVTV